MDMLLSRNPKLAAEVALAFPEFDSKKAASYGTTYKDFTSGKTSVALNSGGTALKHLAELKAINDENPKEVHIAGSPAAKRFDNKLNTVAGELVKFYGMPDTDASINSMKSGMGGFFNRNAAIVEQSKSMGDKLDSYEQEWKNAAPSKAYEAPMPFIDDKAKDARAALDPNYAATRKAEKAGGAAASTVAAPAPSGKVVSLAAARQIPAMKGLSDDQIRAAITAQGHQVSE
jgi:hypothetical protein